VGRESELRCFAQDDLAMTHGCDTKVLEVRIGQSGNAFTIETLLDEEPTVVVEPDTLEPAQNVECHVFSLDLSGCLTAADRMCRSSFWCTIE
jgi:hypothetical protein